MKVHMPLTMLLPVSGLSVLLGLLYLPAFRELVQVWWDDPNYGHGFFIPFLAGCMAWSRREKLGTLTVQPSAWGWLPLLAGLLLFIVGVAVEMVGGGRGGLFTMGWSFILTLTGLVLLLLGRDFCKQMAIPLAYLAFMIPLPFSVFSVVTVPLQAYATSATTSALHLFGIPALREGTLIHLPAMTLGVVEACSGIRSLLTLLAAAVALGFFTHKLLRWQRLLLVGSAVPVAIVTNTFRITGTGVLAYFFGEGVAQGFFHGFSGWGIFFVAAVLLCAEVFALTKLTGNTAQEEALCNTGP
jgi:exosortase